MHVADRGQRCWRSKPTVSAATPLRIPPIIAPARKSTSGALHATLSGSLRKKCWIMAWLHRLTLTTTTPGPSRYPKTPPNLQITVLTLHPKNSIPTSWLIIPPLSPTATRGNNKECVQLRIVMRCVRPFVKRCYATSVSLFWAKILPVTAAHMPSLKDFLKNLVRSAYAIRHWQKRLLPVPLLEPPLEV